MPQVFNRHHKNAPRAAVYIGRGTPWENLFVIGVDGDRDTVVRLHREWVNRKPELIQKIKKELRGKDLVCSCKPLACHGDILLEIANEPTDT